jgi:hypothetical protein
VLCGKGILERKGLLSPRAVVPIVRVGPIDWVTKGDDQADCGKDLGDALNGPRVVQVIGGGFSNLEFGACPGEPRSIPLDSLVIVTIEEVQLLSRSHIDVGMVIEPAGEGAGA